MEHALLLRRLGLGDKQRCQLDPCWHPSPPCLGPEVGLQCLSAPFIGIHQARPLLALRDWALRCPSSRTFPGRDLCRGALGAEPTLRERPLLCGALVVSSQRRGFFVVCFFLFWDFCSSPFLSLRILTGTSTPPLGKSKEPCCSSRLPAGPTFDGSTPSLHFRGWLGYTCS